MNVFHLLVRCYVFIGLALRRRLIWTKVRFFVQDYLCASEIIEQADSHEPVHIARGGTFKTKLEWKGQEKKSGSYMEYDMTTIQGSEAATEKRRKALLTLVVNINVFFAETLFTHSV